MDVPTALVRLAVSQDFVLSWPQLAAAGVHPEVARRRVRHGRWLKVRRSAYLVAPDRLPAHGSWIRARALALAYPRAVVTGPVAAELHGLDQVPPGPDEIVVAPGGRVRTRPDLRVHVAGLTPGDRVDVRGIPLTTASRTLLDAVCSHDRLTALSMMDAALRRRAVTAADLAGLARRASGRPWASHVADLWALADGRAESGLESRVRLRCLDGGVAPDDLQVDIRDGTGAVLARADLVFSRRSRGRTGLLLVEADGAAVHGSPEALHRDRTRANLLTALGHDILRFTWRDTLDPFVIPAAIRAAV